MKGEKMEFDPTGMINLQYFQEIGDFSEYLDWYDWEVLRWHIFRVDYRRSYESFCKLFPEGGDALMEKPKVGQILYSLNVGNAARQTEQKLTPVKVSKVGRKYFTCRKNGFDTQYYLDGWREKTDYSPNSKLYRNPQEWEDAKERIALLDGIGREFRLWSGKKYTLDQLRRIKAITEE